MNTATTKKLMATAGQVGLRLPIHDTYVETRGSFGAMLFHKPRSKVEVLNDCDQEAYNLSQVMMGQATRASLVSAFAMGVTMPLAQMPMAPADSIARAARFAAKIERDTAAYPKSTRASRRSELRRCGSAISRLDRLFDRLRDVHVEQGTSVELFRRYDWEKALFLCNEKHTDWTTPAGDELAKVLKSARGKVVLIGSEPPVNLRADARWHPHPTLQTIWTNYAS